MEECEYEVTYTSSLAMSVVEEGNKRKEEKKREERILTSLGLFLLFLSFSSP